MIRFYPIQLLFKSVKKHMKKTKLNKRLDDKILKKSNKKIKKIDEIVSKDNIIKIVKNKNRITWPTIDETNLLCNLIYPIDIKTFFKTFYHEKALFIQSPYERISNLIKDGLYGLNIKELLTNSSSEDISVWVHSKETNKINSILLKDIDSAMILYNAGHSLYCRGPAEISELLMTTLAKDLGMGFNTYSIQNDLNGETEIFFSRKGHITDWHFDFMENFTLQLKGKKKWKLRKSSNIKYPLRGCTPHYGKLNIVEDQLKIHKTHGNQYFKFHEPESEPVIDKDENNDFSSEVEIVLDPGNFLYFPAGMWHQVECDEDSISINLSIFPTTYADIITDALKHILLKDPKWRKPVSYFHTNEARNTVDILLKDIATTKMNLLCSKDILPERLLMKGRNNMYRETEESEESENENDTDNDNDDVDTNLIPEKVYEVDMDDSTLIDKDIIIADHIKYYINPLSILIKKEEIPSIHSECLIENTIIENDKENKNNKGYYILHSNFGNIDLTSNCHFIFICKMDIQIKIIDYLIHLASLNNNCDEKSIFTLKDIKKSISEEKFIEYDTIIEHILHFLSYNGYISSIQ